MHRLEGKARDGLSLNEKPNLWGGWVWLFFRSPLLPGELCPPVSLTMHSKRFLSSFGLPGKNAGYENLFIFF